MMKKGFTLAEMVITLGVISVLAAILFPVLRSVMPNEEMMKFKKAYYITERVVSELVNDDDLYPEAAAGNFLANTGGVNYKGQGPFEGNTKFCELFAAKINVTSDVNCAELAFVDGNVPVGTFNTSDSIVWILPITDFADANVAHQIVVDTNGNKAPNCVFGAACQDPDRFTINVFQDGRVMVDGVMEREYLNRTRISRD